MIPTAVIIAIAVESAPTSTDVRRSEPRKLRDASNASTPSVRLNSEDVARPAASTKAGIAIAAATISSTTAK